MDLSPFPRPKKFSLLLIVLFVLFGASCTMIAQHRLDGLYGEESVRERIRPAGELSIESATIWRDAKRVIDSRCIVCHSCYDAPCQLKLTSVNGIDRGASPKVVYSGVRLVAADPTRLDVDAQNALQWRDKGFHPVLNERDQTPEANLRASVLYRMLELKRAVPLPAVSSLGSEFDFSLDRSQVCPLAAEMDGFERDHPLWGMPYGFPGISEEEFSIMRRWVENGALMPPPAPLADPLEQSVREWERFLNGNSLKERLMSRYLYEHLFLGDLVFDQVDPNRAFKMVRSKSRPGEPVAIIPTRRPTDDPEVETFYYRLVPEEESPVAKTQMPYALNRKRMARYRELFLNESYNVTRMPGYDRVIANNPFKVFEEIPPASRYRFMLDEAQFFVMGFIKGPVCRGHVALNVIDDRFWVFFVHPESDVVAQNAAFLSRESDRLSLPSESGSTASALINWHRYAAREKEYLAAKQELLRGLVAKGARPELTGLWNGGNGEGGNGEGGRNTNAALTVFRHFDSATVVRGMVGDTPKTAWVIGYPLFERIHYLLVSEFDVFGNVGHQLLTRLYMDFLRIEGENNFLMLLPASMRVKEHDSWYRGIGASTNEYALAPDNFDFVETGITYSSDDPKKELFEKLRTYLGTARNQGYELGASAPPAVAALTRIKGLSASIFPELSILRVKRSGNSDAVYTILLNRAHLNVGVLYLEKLRLLPEEDTLTVVPGFLGAYPNAFFSVEERDLDYFTERASAIRSEAEYRALLDRFGVRRTAPDFWQFSDWLQTAHRQAHGDDTGQLDYSRVEDR